MINRLLPLVLLFSPAALPAQSDDAEAEAPTTLESLAQGADYIGLLQVVERDYEETRDIPTEGTAFLRALVTYRHPGELREPPEEVPVYEEGVGASKCYYPERQNEGHRFLAFLQKRPDDEGYVGTLPGCMLPVYVTEDNRYALRYPIEGLEIRDRSLIREVRYADPDAYVGAGEEISYGRSQELRERELVHEVERRRFIYTYGIYLQDIGPMLRGPGKDG